jgi:hypothetical protein
MTSVESVSEKPLYAAITSRLAAAPVFSSSLFSSAHKVELIAVVNVDLDPKPAAGEGA